MEIKTSPLIKLTSIYQWLQLLIWEETMILLRMTSGIENHQSIQIQINKEIYYLDLTILIIIEFQLEIKEILTLLQGHTKSFNDI